MDFDHFPEATVVGVYPIMNGNTSSSKSSHTALKSGSNVVDFDLNMDNDVDRNNMDETIERSGNLFSQLDYMLEAVQMEKTALDSMRDSLKELENLRSQVSHLTKKLFEADQTNVNLRANLNKMQEAYIEVKKSKSDVEGALASLKIELGKTKEICNKERTARLSAQKEVVDLKEQLAKLGKQYEDLTRESRTIDSVQESNSILQQEISALRQRYREEKASWGMQMRHMESQYNREMDVMKSDVRALAMRTLDVVGTQNYGSNMNMNMNMNLGNNMNNMNSMSNMNMGGKQKHFNPTQRNNNIQFQQVNNVTPSPNRYMDQTDSSQASLSSDRDSFMLSDYYGEDNMNGQSFSMEESSNSLRLSFLEVGDNDNSDKVNNRNYQGFEQYRSSGGNNLKLPSIS